MKNSGQFKKGITPWNTGTKGVMKPNVTSFKKGHGFIPMIERLESKIVKTDSCWLWTASKNNKGYGRLRVNKRTGLAHRLMYKEKIGAIPEGVDVLHSCDNPPCINPAHLFLGTHRDNMQDMSRKDRWGNQTRRRI